MRYLAMALMTGSMALSAGQAKAADEITIAVFTKNLTNPSYQAFRIAADQIAQAAGVRVIHFVPKQPDNVGEQKAMVEQVLKDKPDAVIFIPVDDVAMIPSVKELNEAKIPVILVTNPLPGSFVTYVGADDYEIGYREAHYLFDTLGGRGKIVVIEGIPAAATNRERVRGYKRAVAEYPGIEVLGSGNGNYQQPDAKRVMEKFLAAYPQIDAVLSANDGMALRPSISTCSRSAARRPAPRCATSSASRCRKRSSCRPRSSTRPTTRPGLSRWSSVPARNGPKW